MPVAATAPGRAISGDAVRFLEVIVVATPCPLLLVAYDAPYPEPLNAKRPLPDSFSVAFAILHGTML